MLLWHSLRHSSSIIIVVYESRVCAHQNTRTSIHMHARTHQAIDVCDVWRRWMCAMFGLLQQDAMHNDVEVQTFVD